MKFRKKPVVIDAFHYKGYEDFNLLRLFVGQARPLHDMGDGKIGITTLEGVMEASPGDWIIKGVKGEFYPCKPDIFAATYEPAEEVVSEKTESPKGKWCEHTRQFDCTTLGDCNDNGCQRDRNFISDKQETPRTDACFEAAQSLIRKYGTTDGVGPEFESGNAYHLARQLERELADVTDRLAGYERHVAVLEGIQETHEEEALSARGGNATTDFVPQPHRHQGPVAGCAECERESQSLHLCPACGFPHDPNERG